MVVTIEISGDQIEVLVIIEGLTIEGMMINETMIVEMMDEMMTVEMMIEMTVELTIEQILIEILIILALGIVTGIPTEGSLSEEDTNVDRIELTIIKTL